MIDTSHPSEIIGEGVNGKNRKMRIGIVDADLIGREKHRFPNLVCEKISGYWRDKGAEVSLLFNYDWYPDLISEYDHIYISKVFTDTPVPEWLTIEAMESNPVIHIGGTGFYFDKAPNLSYEIEHHMPDYNLYDEWIVSEVEKEKEKKGEKYNETQFLRQFREYREYSIGFLTRGCFRKCKFCVNQKYDHVFTHSPIEEFHDSSRPRICLLDDNFLGCPEWRRLFSELEALGKPFKFKQGLDERLLTDEKCKLLFNSNYDGDYTFAFDNLSDYDLIESKLQMIRKYTNTNYIKFYVLVGFEGIDGKDIEGAFKRIELLMRYHCVPYIMRYQNKNDCPWKTSKYRGMYIQLARWCNQQSLYKKMSFRAFCEANQALVKTQNLCAPYKAMLEFENDYPEIAKKYFDLRFETLGLRNELWTERTFGNA